ncbi:MAG: aminoacyl-tRNA hydrolase [Deltaproteobacteria bacterium]|nr:aminoacyl-tRNA hydrolase [Deltaproteobacteria bacterium]
MKLVVGLGNPGEAYRWTRHNVGFLAIEELAERHGIGLRRGFQSLYGRGRIAGEEVVLAKPLIYMNRSGEAVGQLLRFFRLLPQDLVIVQDDLDLPAGEIRIRTRGGAGGHLGVSSILEILGHDGFVRVKVGIGRPPEGVPDPADFVLQKLTGAERESIRDSARKAAQAVEILLAGGPAEAMARFHRRVKAEGSKV